MGNKKPTPTMTDVLRSEIERSEFTRYQMAQATGLTQASLSRFVNGQTSLRLDRADLLAEFLGLELTKRKEH